MLFLTKESMKLTEAIGSKFSEGVIRLYMFDFLLVLYKINPFVMSYKNFCH